MKVGAGGIIRDTDESRNNNDSHISASESHYAGLLRKSRVHSVVSNAINLQICYQHSLISSGTPNKEAFSSSVSLYNMYQWVSGESLRRPELARSAAGPPRLGGASREQMQPLDCNRAALTMTRQEQR